MSPSVQSPSMTYARLMCDLCAAHGQTQRLAAFRVRLRAPLPDVDREAGICVDVSCATDITPKWKSEALSLAYLPAAFPAPGLSQGPTRLGEICFKGGTSLDPQNPAPQRSPTLGLSQYNICMLPLPAGSLPTMLRTRAPAAMSAQL